MIYNLEVLLDRQTDSQTDRPTDRHIYLYSYLPIPYSLIVQVYRIIFGLSFSFISFFIFTLSFLLCSEKPQLDN